MKENQGLGAFLLSMQFFFSLSLTLKDGSTWLNNVDIAINTPNNLRHTRLLQKVLSLDYFSATFYLTYFYYKTSKYSPFTETHFCNLFTQSQKADK